MTGKFDIHFLWERCACGADTITSLLGCTTSVQGPGMFEDGDVYRTRWRRGAWHVERLARSLLSCVSRQAYRSNSVWPETVQRGRHFPHHPARPAAS